MLTEEVWIVEFADKGKAGNDRSTCNAAHSDERDQGYLSSALELQIPYKKSGDDGEGEIRHDAEHTIHVGETNDDIVWDALFQSVILPEAVYGPALEDNDKEESPSRDDSREHGSIEDPGVYPFKADPEKKEPNGHLSADHRPAVEDVAEPPAMPRCFDILFLQIPMVPPSPIVYSNNGRCYVQNHE